MCKSCLAFRGRGTWDELHGSYDNGKGIECANCARRCQLEEGQEGYCGIYKNNDGTISRALGNPSEVLATIEEESFPTECVPGWACPVHQDASDGDRCCGVFIGSCSLDCLYCQTYETWDRMVSEGEEVYSPDIIVDEVLDNGFSCVSFFGGSPEIEPQAVYSIAKKIAEVDDCPNICLETNGYFSEKWMEKIAQACFDSGGGIKIDLKAFSPRLYTALAGADVKRVFKNFKKLAEYHDSSEEMPFLRASTVLVPHYIDYNEIKKLSRFIAKQDKTIPYTLLAFSPQRRLTDLPKTSYDFAVRAKEIAEEEGLENVKLGPPRLFKK